MTYSSVHGYKHLPDKIQSLEEEDMEEEESEWSWWVLETALMDLLKTNSN